MDLKQIGISILVLLYFYKCQHECSSEILIMIITGFRLSRHIKIRELLVAHRIDAYQLLAPLSLQTLIR